MTACVPYLLLALASLMCVTGIVRHEISVARARARSREDQT